MAKFDDEQLTQLKELLSLQEKRLLTRVGAMFQDERSYTRQMVKEEVREQLAPVHEKLDELRAANDEDITALSADQARLSRRLTRLTRTQRA